MLGSEPKFAMDRTRRRDWQQGTEVYLPLVNLWVPWRNGDPESDGDEPD